MNGATLLDVGHEVMCQQGDDAGVLAPTHTYRITATRRDARNHMEVKVKNTQGEEHSPWFSVVPHFL
jgi:hypothetical protein